MAMPAFYRAERLSMGKLCKRPTRAFMNTPFTDWQR